MKNKIKLMVIGMAALCLHFNLNAQVQSGSFGYYQDALRFSQSNMVGTARIAGMAGAGSVLGGDLSATALNPAGLGFYNRSQFVFTPSLNFNQYNTAFLGQNSNNEKSRLEFSNLGVVVNFNKSDFIPGGWRGGSIAVTYNRTNDFSQRLTYGANNDNNSIIDAMLDRADGFFDFELGGIEQVGFDHYLINPLPNAPDFYVSPVEGFPFQEESITRSGFTDKINIAGGANYDDKIYVGAGVGIVYSSYNMNRIYIESFAGTVLQSFSIDELFDASGTGFNANVGIIVRPTDFLRVGASITTPTWFNFSEESDAVYNSEYNNFDVSGFEDNGQRVILEDTVLNSLQTQTNVFFSDYDLRTPSKINLGAAFFIGKSGFITADFERINYSNAHVSSSDFSADSDNRTIASIYDAATNIRIGGEYRYKEFRFRGGYASLGDPTNDLLDDVDRSRTVISAGIGMNLGRYFFDFAYSQTKFNDSFTSYTFTDGVGPTAITESKLNNARLTFGLNF
ncbi:OmpP1/FadL family transporter [Roseivirga sp.]|uniref:OmpP1/FadL family transporter n=1 Tax=Roseivirga sp. TaxID=1964215 RepID=UPI003B8ACBC6